jgi:predicted phosphate transport protein (TIGR00153 family)
MVLDNGRFLTQELANVTQMLEEHFRIVVSANKIAANVLTDWLDEHKTVSKKDLAKVTNLEEKGDELKLVLMKKLADANSLMQREDLLRLVHYNDKLVDGAEIACYHLAAVMDSWVPEGLLKKKLQELGSLVMSIVTEQREAVRFLSINMETSMKKADEICRIEKQIDIVQRDILPPLYTSEIGLAKILRLRDFVNVMEEIANLSEDAAITIRSLSLTLHT